VRNEKSENLGTHYPRKDTTVMALFISTTVQWVILPLIMCAIFAFAWIIASSAKTAELRASSWAVFWAGL
jgi:hypothetical protein